MKLGAIIIFFLEAVFCYAQNDKRITIIGKVMDENHISLQNARVTENSGKVETATNKNGFFYLQSFNQNINIEIEYVGYKPFTLIIPIDSVKSIEHDSVFLSFVLEVKSEQLDTITILAEKAKLFYNKPRIMIFDYDFCDEYIVLLVFENQKHKLLLVDSDGNDLFSLALKNSGEKLFRDCYGNIHVLDKDSTHQIKLEGHKLSLLEGHSIEKFNNYVLPIAVSTSTSLFYKSYGLHNQSLTYYNYSKSKGAKTELKMILNSEAENFASYNHKGFRSVQSAPIYYQGELTAGMRYNYTKPDAKMYNGGDKRGGMSKYKTKRVNGNQEAFYQTILTIPTYNPLLLIGDSLFLFDHVDDQILIYNQSGNLSRKIEINYHHQHGWGNELIQDYLERKVYAKYKKKDGIFLSQIDLNNGQILNKFKILNPFCENIKIRNNEVYYLFKDRYQELPIANLYRQKLK